MSSYISTHTQCSTITVWLPTEKHKGNHFPDVFLHFLSPHILCCPSLYMTVTILDFNAGIAFSSLRLGWVSQQQHWHNCWSCRFFLYCCLYVSLAMLKWTPLHLSICRTDFPSGNVGMAQWGWKNKLKLLCVCVCVCVCVWLCNVIGLEGI